MRAIGWEHPRCVAPMRAASEWWWTLTGIEVSWEFRPLTDFNDQPIAQLVEDFDLMIVDHPALPAAVDAGALLAFDELLDGGRLQAIIDAGVGPSAASYRYRDRTWALAADAACHVSAWNPRRLAAPPGDWDGVVALAHEAPGAVALPLDPADAICALLSLAATLGEPVCAEGEVPLRPLQLLCELTPLLHTSSWDCAPPQLLELMAGDERIAYVPLTFGYRGLAGPALRFADAPTGPDAHRATVLGGAGIAISAGGRDPGLAATFAAWLAEPEAQRDIVLAHGGQPAHREAWSAARDPFFADTRQSMEQAYTRPAQPAWHDYQRRAGVELRAGLRASESPERIAARLQAAGVPA